MGAPRGSDDGHDDIGLELVRGLLRGASPDDLAWASGRDADEVIRLAREAVPPADDREPEGISPGNRRRIADYLLLRQSPGQASGTWELLQRSPSACAWAATARERLADLYPSEPPELPGHDEDGSPPGRGERRPRDSERRGPVSSSRAERKRRRTQHQVRSATAIAMSPFRAEAVRRHAASDSEMRLPHYASRPVRLALYGLVGVLAVLLAMCTLISVPVYTTAKVLVVDLGSDGPGGEDGLSLVALFPSGSRDELEEGKTLRVQLPDTEERVSSEITEVEAEVRGPQEVADRYDLPDLQAKRVRRPHAVAVAELKTPDGGPPRDSFEGAVTEEAEARTGSERIIGLLF